MNKNLGRFNTTYSGNSSCAPFCVSFPHLRTILDEYDMQVIHFVYQNKIDYHAFKEKR